jgi:LacI family transcriptional regulator
VSIATVSRVVNAPERVAPTLRARVEQEISRLGYLPRGAARALASRRSDTIGAIVPTIDNAIFAHCLAALQRRLVESGNVLILASSEYDPAQEVAQLRALVARGVDGVMIVGNAHDPALYALLEQRAIPFVETWSYDREAGGAAPGRACVGFDNRAAMARVVGYLVDLGHRRLAMVAGIAAHNDRAASRIAGLREAAAAHGLPVPAIVECRYDIAAARNTARALLGERPRPTALVCGNDVQAYGALFAARDLGLAVPRDVSITGFDDLDLAAHLDPPLTTVRVPSVEMGTLAADYLCARIAGRAVPAHQELDTQLIVRGTTAKPGGG